MPRYIDAYLLSSNIQKYLCSSCSVRCTPFEIKNSACEIAECLRMIYNAPTADVQEVKGGLSEELRRTKELLENRECYIRDLEHELGYDKCIEEVQDDESL